MLIAGTGGFLGSALRLAAGHLAFVLFGVAFPVGTAMVNLLGCFAIGALIKVTAGFSENARLFLVTGLLGGFTTFSAFGIETFTLWKDRYFFAAAANVTLNLVGGLAAVWLGSKIF